MDTTHQVIVAREVTNATSDSAQLAAIGPTRPDPFVTINACTGSTHFVTGTLNRVSTEMRLRFPAYNMKRVIAILSVRSLMEALRA